ncbi:YtpR family tRNA-binding protein [Pseudalkalibacillus hwajinpoensis]|uniref:YtpR family tRNA-binding protein n=1 Tax=Guptibacillus hwajinpoensis TaxID=208199 RepID=UPI00325AA8EA
MNMFYNKEGVGDTLIVTIGSTERGDKAVLRNGNVARIYSKETNQTIGYNLFHFSSVRQLTTSGLVQETEELVSAVNASIKENGFKDELVFDASPKFVVGFVEEMEKHPNADKLNICQVNVGEEKLQIVCGAPNVDEGQKVVVAKVGAVMPSGMIIKDASLRGVESTGMICSARELDLPDAPQEKGILILPDDYEIGSEFKTY